MAAPTGDGQNFEKIVVGQKCKWTLAPLTILLLLLTTGLRGQYPETEKILPDGELQMTFPSIYFKHNSTDYASMPYDVDSCFKFIAAKIEYLNSYPIWRDSSETEQLTNDRILKLKADLKKYTSTHRIRFQTMGDQQKVAQSTINKSTNAERRAYLLSLNRKDRKRKVMSTARVYGALIVGKIIAFQEVTGCT